VPPPSLSASSLHNRQGQQLQSGRAARRAANRLLLLLLALPLVAGDALVGHDYRPPALLRHALCVERRNAFDYVVGGAECSRTAVFAEEIDPLATDAGGQAGGMSQAPDGGVAAAAFRSVRLSVGQSASRRHRTHLISFSAPRVLIGPSGASGQTNGQWSGCGTVRRVQLPLQPLYVLCLQLVPGLRTVNSFRRSFGFSALRFRQGL
jgi:hypothetical protein